MTGAGVAGWLSALAAVGAFGAAAVQIAGLRRDALAARAAELAGVALETDVVTRPVTADAGEGHSRWSYRFTLHNPGRLPISDVEASVVFALPVFREHADKTLDAAATELELRAPVIPARGAKSWERTVLVQHERRQLLRETKAIVSFTAPDAGRLQTAWPDEAPLPDVSQRLRRRLDQLVPDEGDVAEEGPALADARPWPRAVRRSRRGKHVA